MIQRVVYAFSYTKPTCSIFNINNGRKNIKLILNSRTYQLSSLPNETNELDDRFFSHFYPRPMLAQLLLDALNDVTGTQEKFGRYPAGMRAVQLPLPVSSRFLSLFGRSNREFLAELEPKLEPTLTQALHLINSGYINNKIHAGNGTIARLVKSDLTDAQIIRELYLRTLSRSPSPTELAEAKTYVAESRSRREGFEDLLWALISSRSFLFIS